MSSRATTSAAPPRLVDGPIDVAALERAVATVEHGAVVTFLGTARRSSDGRVVERLRYDAYREMAEPVLARILAEAQRRFADARVDARHRVGDCPLGEASVAVVAAAPHRDAAFAACRFVIDTIKKEAPIWKQEQFTDGSCWVGDPASARSTRAGTSGAAS
jgi:molybdopterin synthase catalytic subunit